MIGVFDSGLGGLTVLKEIRHALPAYDYLYLGDTLHVPYGNRSDEAIYELTRKACDFLFARDCKLIIIACNTASAKALRRLQQEYLPAVIKEKNDSRNILGVIRPLAEYAAKETKNIVGVIGTRATVNSGAYMVELNKLNPKIKVAQNAAPLLVPLIEENWLKRKETASILRYYLKPVKERGADLLILGCTHYPMILKKIRRIMGKRCRVPHPGQVVAESLADYLHRHPEIESVLARNNKIEYLATDLNNQFKLIANNFLGESIKIAKVVI